MRAESYEIGGLKGWPVRHNSGDPFEHTRPPNHWKAYHPKRGRNGIRWCHTARPRTGMISSTERGCQKRMLSRQFRARSRAAISRGDFDMPRLSAVWLF